MGALTAKRWIVNQADPERAQALAQAVGVSPIIAQLLLNRGVCDAKAAHEFLYPELANLHSPFLLQDMDAAVAAIVDAVNRGRRIVIYGDYDVDGTTSTSLLLKVFRQLEVSNIQYYIPNRLDEGYGLNPEAVQQLAQSGAGLILTVDCGVTAVEEVKLANQLGMQVVVTDHHLPGLKLPEAAAVVDPHRADCQYPFSGLAGVGVAFKLAQALLHVLGKAPARWDQLGSEFLDLVALGTIADVAPIKGENRALVKYGLRQMATTRNLGLQALLDVSGLAGEQISTRSVAFGLAPRINAMGRMAEAQSVVHLLTTDDELTARAVAQQLDEHNRKRQALEAALVEEAIAVVESEGYADTDKVLVVAKAGWHHGVIGIVASRLVERYYRPVIVIALEDGVGKGSARSIDGFDLFGALKQCDSVLEGYGGHTMAAGVTVLAEKLSELRQRLNQVADSWLSAEDLVPKVGAELEVSLSDLTIDLVEQIQLLAPFGSENPQPVFASCGVPLSHTRAVGKDGRHLQLYFSPEVGVRQGVAFRQGLLAEELVGLAQIDIAYQPDINEYQGVRSVQPKVSDIRVSQSYLRESLLERVSAAVSGLPESTAYDGCSGADWVLAGEADETAAALSERPDTITAQACRWLDGRDEDKGSYLRDLLGASSNPIVVWVSRIGYAISLARNIEKAFPALDQRIAVWGENMSLSLQDEVVSHHQAHPWRVVVTDSHSLPDQLLGRHSDLVVYHCPPGPVCLGKLTQYGSKAGGAIHLLYDQADAAQAQQLLNWSWPDTERLRKTYMALQQLCPVDKEHELEALFLDIGARVKLTRAGLARALGVLEDVGLCQLDTDFVVLKAAPEKKLDLKVSVRYNTIVRHRADMETWIDLTVHRPLAGLQQLAMEAAARV